MLNLFSTKGPSSRPDRKLASSETEQNVVRWLQRVPIATSIQDNESPPTTTEKKAKFKSPKGKRGENKTSHTV